MFKICMSSYPGAILGSEGGGDGGASVPLKGSNCLLRNWNLPSLPESNGFKPKEPELLLNSKSGCSYSIAPIISRNNVI